MRLVRCPRCRLQIESVETAPICPGCQEAIVSQDDAQGFDDETRERIPTRPNAIIRPEE